MKKVNVNKIFVSWICVYANISIKFDNIGHRTLQGQEQ